MVVSLRVMIFFPCFVKLAISCFNGGCIDLSLTWVLTYVFTFSEET